MLLMEKFKYSDLIIKDKKRQKRIIFSIAFVSFMVSVDAYVVNISLPTISKYFRVGTGEVSWVVLSYLLAVTGTLLIFGKLGDRIGLTPAMIPKFLPETMRGTAFGYYATFAALGITIGTPLGGIITGYISWHWIFLINIPIGIMAIIFCKKAIPDDRPVSSETDDKRFDMPGAIISFLSCVLFLYGLNMGKEKGWTSPLILGCFISSLVLLILFVLIEKRIKYPLLDLTLFKDKAFTYGNLASSMAVGFQSGTIFLIPFYLELVKGLKTQQVGAVILVYSVVYMFGSLYSGKISDKVNPRFLCTLGMIIASISAFAFAFALKFAGLTAIIIFLICLAAAYALFIPSNNNVVMGMSPPGKHGVVSGVFRMGIYLSLACGVAIFETIYSLGTPSVAGNSMALNTPTPESLICGFQNVFLVGGITCLLSVIFSILAGSQKNTESLNNDTNRRRPQSGH